MLLTRIRSALTRDDRGAALAAAMSLMLLGALLSVLMQAGWSAQAKAVVFFIVLVIFSVTQVYINKRREVEA